MFWMELALNRARQAEENGEVPVGAVIVKNSELVATGENRVIRDSDPSAHAELVAMRAAGKILNNYRLPGCELYVTLEPCPMCAGAIVHARLQRVIFACTDPRTGAAGSVFNLLESPALNHQCTTSVGLCSDESSQMLKNFFARKRK